MHKRMHKSEVIELSNCTCGNNLHTLHPGSEPIFPNDIFDVCFFAHSLNVHRLFFLLQTLLLDAVSDSIAKIDDETLTRPERGRIRERQTGKERVSESDSEPSTFPNYLTPKPSVIKHSLTYYHPDSVSHPSVSSQLHHQVDVDEHTQNRQGRKKRHLHWKRGTNPGGE